MEILTHTKPVKSVRDGLDFFGIEPAQGAPTFVIDADGKLHALILSAARGHIDFKKLAKLLGAENAELASRRRVESATGIPIGAIPLTGLNMPYVLDASLLRHDYVYGGTGCFHTTAKASPQELIAINQIELFYE
ncbi:aminoacyl-tRNA deacylase [Chromobacterium sp. IIBBL 290-4]|uniref:aminoacyl-tRNA deacylase n=1 Tax=Chromobacterium sp. IIBBL 290-4 TaxID=2953890 RepID=UPI0020B6C45C|nr:YbaK/EbsC family protein [Chromobacterium sp. IIBBL 290-4]UTH73567.1 YbaK/EbsC family protein [Chromobacterium sp. IIBBL 290-4]